jgi:hypothetical protein
MKKSFFLALQLGVSCIYKYFHIIITKASGREREKKILFESFTHDDDDDVGLREEGVRL